VHVGSIQTEVLWICLQFGCRLCNKHVVAYRDVGTWLLGSSFKEISMNGTSIG